MGPAWIGAELGVPPRTRLSTAETVRLLALDPRTGEVIRASKATAVRYERSRPGELGHLGRKFIKPHFPWQNGKVERLIRILVTEWVYRQAFTNNDQRAAARAHGSSTTTLTAATAHLAGAASGQPPDTNLMAGYL